MVTCTFTNSIQPSLAFKLLSMRLPSLILTIVLVSQWQPQDNCWIHWGQKKKASKQFACKCSRLRSPQKLPEATWFPPIPPPHSQNTRVLDSLPSRLGSHNNAVEQFFHPVHPVIFTESAQHPDGVVSGNLRSQQEWEGRGNLMEFLN